MVTRTSHNEANVGTGRPRSFSPIRKDDDRGVGPRLTGEEVWRALAKASFAVLGYVTPSGDPRSSGVVYRTVDRHLYVVVGSDSWKARHISAAGRVAVTVPVHRGGILSLVFPIPPATISFHAKAVVHSSESPRVRAIVEEAASTLPRERRVSSSVIEIVPEGSFVMYGLGVPLMKMRDPAKARARVPVSLACRPGRRPR